jgi:hypothetical protein
MTILFLTSCQNREKNAASTPPPAATQTPPAQAAPPASAVAPAALSATIPAAPAGAVIAGGQDPENPDLRRDLLEVKRVSGGAPLAKWGLVNTGARGSGLWDLDHTNSNPTNSLQRQRVRRDPGRQRSADPPVQDDVHVSKAGMG